MKSAPEWWRGQQHCSRKTDAQSAPRTARSRRPEHCGNLVRTDCEWNRYRDDSGGRALGRIFMPNRFEKYTRAGTPGGVTLSADTVRHQAIRQPRPAASSDMVGQDQVRGPSLPKNVRRGHRFRDAVRTDGSGCLQHAIPRHGAVGLRFVSQGCWSRRLQSDPVRQTGATRFAHPPSDDAGQPGLASSPCFHTRQFNKIGLPAQIPIGCRPAVCPRRQTGRSGLMLPGGPVAVSTTLKTHPGA